MPMAGIHQICNAGENVQRLGIQRTTITTSTLITITITTMNLSRAAQSPTTWPDTRQIHFLMPRSQVARLITTIIITHIQDITITTHRELRPRYENHL